jgi:hypothetical protein
MRATMLAILAVSYMSTAVADEPVTGFVLTAQPICAVAGGPVVARLALKWEGDLLFDFGPGFRPGQKRGVVEMTVSRSGWKTTVSLRPDAQGPTWKGDQDLTFEPGEELTWILPLNDHFLFFADEPIVVTFTWKLIDFQVIPNVDRRRATRSVKVEPTVSLALVPRAPSPEALAEVESRMCSLLDQDRPTEEEWDTATCLVLSLPGDGGVRAAFDLMRAWSRQGPTGVLTDMPNAVLNNDKYVHRMYGYELQEQLRSRFDTSPLLRRELISLCQHQGGPWMWNLPFNSATGDEDLTDDEISALLNSVDMHIQWGTWRHYRRRISNATRGGLLEQVNALEQIAASGQQGAPAESVRPVGQSDEPIAEPNAEWANELEAKVAEAFSVCSRSPLEMESLATAVSLLNPRHAGRWAYPLLEREPRISPESAHALRVWVGRSFDASPAQRAELLRHLRDYGNRHYAFLFDEWRARGVKLSDEEVGLLLKSTNKHVLAYTLRNWRRQCPPNSVVRFGRQLANFRRSLNGDDPLMPRFPVP